MKKLITSLSLIVLVGCTQVQPQQATHEWSAKRKSLQALFAENNTRCSTQAINVESYENCMKEKGYYLLARN